MSISKGSTAWRRTWVLLQRTLALAVAIVHFSEVPPALAQPFAVSGDVRVDPSRFRVTTFAEGLNFPYSMQVLGDGSMLVATSTPVTSSYFNSTGQLLRLVDANQDGIADGPGTTLFTGLPGIVTAVRQAGDLVLATSSQAGSERISVLRTGATPGASLSLLGSINFAFPVGWEHKSYTLEVRPTPAQSGKYDVFFNVGSKLNATNASDTVAVTGLVTGSVLGESIYQVTLQDLGSSVSFSNLTQIASGLRNAAGIAVEPATGDLYFQDNGIDTPGNLGEPLSADEINRIPAAQIGGAVETFGFATDYIQYRTGTHVGSGAVQPLVSFQPIPDPWTGSESEGATEITFAPPDFPLGLNHGIFVGFHGQTQYAGLANEENPLLFVDPVTGQYFDFISNDEPGIGHLDSVVASGRSLFVADLSSTGALSGLGTGKIYQITYVPEPGDANLDGLVDGVDYVAWADHFLQTGQTWRNGDFNGDGIVNGVDYTIWADHYAPAGLSILAVPEPSALALAAIGVMGLLVAARRIR